MNNAALVVVFGFLAHSLVGMESQGPMNSEWFYDLKSRYYIANFYHQGQHWKEASQIYKDALNEGEGSPYDQNMACLNLAICKMARRKSSEHFKSFDKLIEIEKNQQLPHNLSLAKGKKIVVQSNLVGIGDIVHFLEAVGILKDKTNAQVTLSVRRSLLGILKNAANFLDISLIDQESEQPEVDYKTHIVSLMGHLEIKPTELSPLAPILFAPEEALQRVNNLINPLINNGKKIVAVFLGEDRQATLIGGKQLPRDKQRHGRHLEAKAFKLLLKRYPETILIDCGTKDSKIKLEKFQDRIVDLPVEKQPFDTIIALAQLMNRKSAIVAIGADNGPTNVFSRALTHNAQDRMIFVIPNGEESDMRMNGEGDFYRQMISNSWVCACKHPAEQKNKIVSSYRTVIQN